MSEQRSSARQKRAPGRAHPLALAVQIALLGVIAPLAAHAQAQSDDSTKLERVEVTGSSIKRIAGESGLPVQVLSQADIARTGFMTATDLIQNLPAMQGFTTSSQSVNGGGGGVTNASLHAMGAGYTLVLLNGHRVAPYNTGSTVNLNAIPLSAIESVEVLTDGASALYGSDAIAGVVNFITKKDRTDGSFDFQYTRPQHPGGGSFALSGAKGFGDIDRDRFNIMVSASYDKQDELWATQRPFSSTGILKFTDQGQAQSVNLLSSNNVPGNITTLTLSNGKSLHNLNPYLLSSGSCVAGEVQSGNRCLFDYSAHVEDLPAFERASFYTTARYKLNDDVQFFGELLLSHFKNSPVYAPPAQQNIQLPLSLLTKDVNPLLAGLGQPAGVTATAGLMNLRVFDAGGRADIYTTNSRHLVLGAEGNTSGWDWNGSFIHSVNDWSDQANGGYVSKIGFNNLVASGQWDPLMSPPGSSVAALAPIVLHNTLDQSTSTLDVLSARASRAIGKIDNRDISLGMGADYTRQEYKDSPSAILQGTNALQPNYQDAIIGGGGGALPFDASRKNYGLFAEVVAPITKQLEVTASTRYDSYDKVQNSENFDANGNPTASASQGLASSGTTYKVALRYQPAKEWLMRASVGTGFKAPSLADIANPFQFAGSTGFHPCPPGLPAALASACFVGNAEYNSFSGGNPNADSSGLRPEKSTQWAAGVRYEPSNQLSVGADVWHVWLHDQISSVTENTAFSNGALYSNLFKVLPDPITGVGTLSYLGVPINTGSARYSGVDFDAAARAKLSFGDLTTRLKGTYMIQADYQLPGTPGYLTSMSKIGADGTVTFRYQVMFQATLDTGKFSNTVTVNYKPGYMDDTTDWCRTDASGNCLMTKFGDQQGRYVSSYTLVDWQTKYNYSKTLSFTLGIKNLFDTNPPFSLVDQSGTGNAKGFDGRYTDPVGRSFYLAGNYKF